MENGFFLFIFCFSLIFMVPGFIILVVDHHRKKRYQMVTEGKIIRFEDVRTVNSTTNLHPVYEYVVNEKRYCKRGGYISHLNLEVGMPVCIMYNPDCPSQSFIKGYDSKIQKIFGMAFIGIGLFILLMVLIIFLLLMLV